MSNMSETILSADQLRDILPQSYPFLLIDRVIQFEKDKSLTVVKNITSTEWFFHGQENADEKGVPPMLLVEAAAQAGLVLLKKSSPHSRFTVFLAKFSVEFDRALRPGKIFFRALAGKFMADKGFFDVEISLDEELIARVNFFYSLKHHD